MREIPESLRHGAFTRAQAEQAGVTSRMLQGQRFRRLHTGVWCCADHEMTDRDWVAAAQLALPSDAAVTGITRIQQLGLDFGPVTPRRFVIARDHHLVLDEVFLHRTPVMPPLDEAGVTPAAAFLGYCARARVIDAIKVGDWLLANKHMTKPELEDLALSQLWRSGAPEAAYIVEHLSDRCRSLQESETCALLTWAGLPRPEMNVLVSLERDVTVEFDLLYRLWRTAVEYEGTHHQEDRGQYTRDIDRYAILRAHDVAYVQATKEKLSRPQTFVGEMHRCLARRGYDGPPPAFGERWRMLFMAIRKVIGPRTEHVSAAGDLRAVS